MNSMSVPKTLMALAALMLVGLLALACAPTSTLEVPPASPTSGAQLGQLGGISIPETPGAERPTKGIIGVPETPEPIRTPPDSRLGWRQISASEAIVTGTPRSIVRDFVVKSATFHFDGIPQTLQLEWELASSTGGVTGWEVSFRFQSSSSGYGDRTGKPVAQVITPHKGVVVIQGGRVVSAIMDGVWDMMKEAPVVK